MRERRKNKEEKKRNPCLKIFCLVFISEFYYFYIFTNFSQSSNSKKFPQCPYPYLWGNNVYLFNWTRQYLVISLYLHILFSLLRTLSFLYLGMDFLENMIKQWTLFINKCTYTEFYTYTPWLRHSPLQSNPYTARHWWCPNICHCIWTMCLCTWLSPVCPP